MIYLLFFGLPPVRGAITVFFGNAAGLATLGCCFLAVIAGVAAGFFGSGFAFSTDLIVTLTSGSFFGSTFLAGLLENHPATVL